MASQFKSNNKSIIMFQYTLQYNIQNVAQLTPPQTSFQNASLIQFVLIKKQVGTVSNNNQLYEFDVFKLAYVYSIKLKSSYNL